MTGMNEVSSLFMIIATEPSLLTYGPAPDATCTKEEYRAIGDPLYGRVKLMCGRKSHGHAHKQIKRIGKKPKIVEDEELICFWERKYTCRVRYTDNLTKSWN
ncbi:hypothetical protein A0H81_07940 [Grifola frondosa]|uniref:Uncharacterized protein n=1 Tax=Grifola frondosa TaxID=5627 RepID=A0A1C7M5J6_GRIFR|nr:hypothetical protein A0H81_07940 [Grifola frondosa]